MILGIDPGLAGGIAFLEPALSVVTGGVESHPARVYPMPVAKAKSGRPSYDIAEIVRILSPRPTRPHAFLEKGQPLPPMLAGRGAGGSGSIANYHRGLGRGLFEGILTALGIPYELVTPRQWQDEMLPLRGGSTKDRSIIAARKLFPTVSLFATSRSRKASDGLADALCIAEFGRRRFANAETAPGLFRNYSEVAR